MIKTQLYFAYGSNMDRDQMRFRCKHAQFIKTAVLKGHKFYISSRHYASVIEDPNSVVHGVLWLLTSKCEESLDRYEAVSSGLYNKVYLNIPELSEEKVLIYIDPIIEIGKPKPGYLEKILQAAHDLGFSEQYIRELEQFL